MWKENNYLDFKVVIFVIYNFVNLLRFKGWHNDLIKERKLMRSTCCPLKRYKTSSTQQNLNMNIRQKTGFLIGKPFSSLFINQSKEG